MMGNRQDRRGFEIVDRVSEMLAQGRAIEAEELLIASKAEAVAASDSGRTELIMSELISLYCTGEPRQYRKAEEVSLEREALKRDAGSRLQTAMLLFYSARDPKRAAAKAREAVEMSREQSDYVSLYSSVSLLGLVSVRLQHNDEALSLLNELEGIIHSDAALSSPRRFVVGDETTFLEALKERNLAGGQVRRIASALVSLCRDPSFGKRLSVLASS